MSKWLQSPNEHIQWRHVKKNIKKDFVPDLPILFFLAISPEPKLLFILALTFLTDGIFVQILFVFPVLQRLDAAAGETTDKDQ